MTADSRLDVGPIRDTIIDHALARGLFDVVGGHEPKRAPGNGLTAAVWVQTIDTVQSSGLAQTSGRVIFQARIYAGMVSEPQDAIDPVMSNAAGAWLAALVGDYTLGGTVRQIDVRGIHGAALAAQAGYIEQDGRLFRVYTITIPCLVNDLFDEAE